MRWKHILISILLYVLTIVNGMGQQVLFNDTSYLYSSNGGGNIIKVNDSVYCINYNTSGTNGETSAGFALLNSNGKIIKKNHFHLAGYVNTIGGFGSDLILSKNKKYLYCTGEKNLSSSKGWQITLFKLNLNLYTIFCKSFSDTSGQIAGRSMFEDDDGNLNIGGWIDYNYANDFNNTVFNVQDILIYKVDSLGHLIWNKTITTSDAIERVFAIAPAPNKGYALAGGKGMQWGKSSPSFWIIDSTGSIQHQKTISSGSYFCGFNYMMQLSDGNYLAVGYKSGTLLAVKFNAQAQIIWQSLFSNLPNSSVNELYSADELPNGDLIMAGIKSFMKNDSTSCNAGLILKTDANGTVKWYRLYDRSIDFTQFNYGKIQDLIALNDTGFYAIGWFSASEQPIWLLKTDSLGCDNDTCSPPFIIGVNNVSTDGLFLYPNPAKDFITIELPKNIIPKNIEIINSNGNPVFTHSKSGLQEQQKTIFIGDIAKGIYIIRVISEDRVYRIKFIKE
ncbi:MAG: T9SS type A sorting domain-containing protein [Bacteroidia bacterium]|nr:T9SS type A sorting domain-containing protein [Bacteroidia bacterium]